MIEQTVISNLTFAKCFDRLKNNIEIDVIVKCVEEQNTQAELAEKAGTFHSYVNRLIINLENIVNKTFMQMLEQL